MRIALWPLPLNALYIMPPELRETSRSVLVPPAKTTIFMFSSPSAAQAALFSSLQSLVPCRASDRTVRHRPAAALPLSDLLTLRTHCRPEAKDARSNKSSALFSPSAHKSAEFRFLPIR